MATKVEFIPANSPIEFTLENPSLPLDLTGYTVKAIAVDKAGTRYALGSGAGSTAGTTITITGGDVGSLTAGSKYRVIFPADTSWTDATTPTNAVYPTIKGRGYRKLFLLIDSNT